MADESNSGGFQLADIVFWLLFIGVFYALIQYLISILGFSFNLDFLPDISVVFSFIFNVVQVIAVFLSLFFLLGIIYLKSEINNLTGHDHGHHDHDDHSSHEHPHDTHEILENVSNIKSVYNTPGSNQRWQKIQEKINSIQESDWRLAIIDSDIILHEMLTKMGYEGETIAEKLKKVEESDFSTLNKAWEAHKVRNEIAHAGSNFHLNRKEAERVIGLYKEVFEEFYFI